MTFYQGAVHLSKEGDLTVSHTTYASTGGSTGGSLNFRLGKALYVQLTRVGSSPTLGSAHCVDDNNALVGSQGTHGGIDGTDVTIKTPSNERGIATAWGY